MTVTGRRSRRPQDREPRSWVNDFGNSHYDGLKPPEGHGLHYYRFRLSALDVETLHCGKKARIADLLDKARPHVIVTTELVGAYESR
ncbi:hypothetical protein [Ancylobacter sp. IITR112]|uniref:hypothetical protein n=1 Tax=Ancylobacter sp. IITR112 TaxID=3138073 RepID=UPI00352AB3B1